MDAIDMGYKGFLGGTLFLLMIYAVLENVRRMAAWEMSAGLVLGGMLGVMVVQHYPEYLSQPITPQLDVASMTIQEYMMGILPLVGLALASWLWSRVRFLRIGVLAMWIAVAIGVAVRVGFTLSHGGFGR